MIIFSALPTGWLQIWILRRQMSTHKCWLSPLYDYSFGLHLQYVLGTNLAPSLQLFFFLFGQVGASPQPHKLWTTLRANFATIFSLFPIAIRPQQHRPFADMPYVSSGGRHFNGEKCQNSRISTFDGEELTVKTAQKLRERFQMPVSSMLTVQQKRQ